ncbi:MAG: hypothetical protein IKX79_02665 [Desulfovibrionaceae bacterium]|nr:hypothetical protein [Desulfovibrionaceae bacterium]
MLLACLLGCAFAGDARADDEAQGKASALEDALSSALDAAQMGRGLTQGSVDVIVSAAADAFSGKGKAPVVQARKEQGKGIFYQTTLRIPLRTFMGYLLNVDVPGEALYPTSVRCDAWRQPSRVKAGLKPLLESSFPPSAMLTASGEEREETTPDESSGCHYRYTLKRLFALANVGGRTALLSVSVMPAASETGEKGAIADEKNWRYVYDSKVGTNMAMMGGAATKIYGAATVSVYMEDKPGGSSTKLGVFKWTRAGWSGMNVVQQKHITKGIKRYIDGMRKVFEASGRPSPAKIAAEASRLQGLDKAALCRLLEPESQALASSTADILKASPYKEAVSGGKYAETLTAEQLRSEAIKCWMRRQTLGR